MTSSLYLSTSIYSFLFTKHSCSYLLPEQIFSKLEAKILELNLIHSNNSSESLNIKKEVYAFFTPSSPIKEPWLTILEEEEGLDFFASFFRIKTVGEKVLFNNISEVIRFVGCIQENWQSSKSIPKILSKSKLHVSDYYIPPRVILKKIKAILGSIETLKKLALLGYSEEEISYLIELEGEHLQAVAEKSKKLFLAKAEVLALLGQTNYQQTSKKIKTLVLTAASVDGKVEKGFMSFCKIEFFDSIKFHCNPRYRFVSSVRKLKNELERAAIDKPSIIIIRGHGSQYRVSFSKGEYLTCDTEISEFKNLHDQTTVIFESCGTGTGKNTLWNLANYVASIAPRLRIFAPTCPITSMYLICTPAIEPVFIENNNKRAYLLNSNQFNFRTTFNDELKSSEIKYEPNPQKIITDQTSLMTAYKNEIFFDKVKSISIKCIILALLSADLILIYNILFLRKI